MGASMYCIAAIVSVGALFNFNPRIFNNLVRATNVDYQIVFDSTSGNSVTLAAGGGTYVATVTGGTSVSGQFTKLNDGGYITFDFNAASKTAGVSNFQSIKSVTINGDYSKLTVYGSTYQNKFDTPGEYFIGSNSSGVYTFTYSQNYLKVLNNSGSEANVASIKISYACGPDNNDDVSSLGSISNFALDSSSGNVTFNAVTDALGYRVRVFKNGSLYRTLNYPSNSISFANIASAGELDETNTWQLKISAKHNDVYGSEYTVGATSKYLIPNATDKSYMDYTIYTFISAVEGTTSSTLVINHGTANTYVWGAVTVDHGDHWVEVKTTGFDKWYRAEWNTDDWWTGMGTWEPFNATTDAIGNITVTTGNYATSDVPDYGPYTIGTTIYVAVKAGSSAYRIDPTTDKSYGSSYSHYAIKLLAETESITLKFHYGSVNTNITGAITADNTDRWVNVKTGSFNKWFRTGDPDWWAKMGTWVEYSGTTDSNGDITIQLNDYGYDPGIWDTGPLTVGTTVYLALKTA